MAEVDQEAVNDCAKLIMHRLLARQISVDPSIVAKARSQVGRWESEMGPRDFVDDWKRLLSLHDLSIRRVITGRSEHMAWLRSSTPFSSTHALPLTDVGLRRRIWRMARRHVQLRQHSESATIETDLSFP